jgi:phosphatidate cytidylyltransferase
MFKTRVILGVLLVAIVVGVLALDVYLVEWEVFSADYAPGFYALLVFLIIAGMVEFSRMLGQSSRPCHPVLATVFALLFVAWRFFERHAPASLPPLLRIPGPHIYLAVIAILLFLLFVTEIRKAELRGGSGPALESISWTVLSFVYIGFLSAFAMEVRFFPGSALGGTYALALTLGVAKMCDIGAYVVGRLLGRHKLTPALSPNKTVEGAIGGVLFGLAAALGIGLGWPVMGFSWPQLLIFGLAVSLAAQTGDLADSLIKRACHAKHSGQMAGFGGVLDIVDSVLFSMPVAFVLFAVLTRAGV